MDVASYSMVQPPARVFDEVPVLCGHRGSGRGIVGGWRENTLGSCRAAVAAGVRWLEIDARATADGVLVASHDPAAVDGRPIAALCAEEADELRLMRIADLLAALPPEVGINLEIKTALEDALRPRARTTGALTAELAARHGTARPLLLTSFDASVVGIVRERAPGVPVGLLTWMGFPLRKAIPAAVHLGADVVAPHVESFRLHRTASPDGDVERAVRVAHEAGLQVVAWCPGPEDAERLIAAGVDCLIVDDVPAAVSR